MSGRVGAALRRKLGPLPVWVWALIGGAALYVYRNRNGGGLLGGSSGTRAVVTPGLVSVPGVAAGNHHKKRRRKHPHPKPKHHPKPKGKHPHHHPKPKKKRVPKLSELNFRSKPRRDRTGVELGVTHAHGSHRSRPRGRFAKMGGETPAVHVAHRARELVTRPRSSVGLPVPQGRAHTGADGLAFRRHRTSTPPAQGRNDRRRPLTDGQNPVQIGRPEEHVETHASSPTRRTSSPAPARQTRHPGRSR